MTLRKPNQKARLYILVLLLYICVIQAFAQSPEGYRLWLDFKPLTDTLRAADYRSAFQGIYMAPEGETRQILYRELRAGLMGMIGQPLPQRERLSGANLLIVATWEELPAAIRNQIFSRPVGPEGFVLDRISEGGRKHWVLTAESEIGLLYGTYRFLRMLQAETTLGSLPLEDHPKIGLRMLNHWDNLDRTVERGYAGFSIWNWHRLPEYLNPRYVDYARANASIGINATVLTSVNANALVLKPEFLDKVSALADLFRPYGLQVFLTARFSAPMEIGGLPTADPLDPEVQQWWKDKAGEIYAKIPDFGGFLVKANSEGQPGPQNYGRSHLQGANMLADALANYGGTLLWRAFVYSEEDPTDRAKQAYAEFQPHDGAFRDNVILQVKNGPIDFQPREPVHPLFGAMPETPLAMEFQITKEYLGFATHLVYLPRLFEEILGTDTYRSGPGSTVASIVDGSLSGKTVSAMAGVSNIGTDLNWTGHPFGQADWYGFGRLAWDPYLSSRIIAEEWIRSTLGNDPEVLEAVLRILGRSREAVVNYMMPLGLHHLFDSGHHYGPGPWVDDLNRPEWNPVYYHQAGPDGIGFDRTASGSDALAQYAPEFAEQFRDPQTCPDAYLLWFHHLPWDFRMKDGQQLWDSLGLRYQLGVDQVREMAADWAALEGSISPGLFHDVRMLLKIQLREAIWWKDACMSFFQTQSKMSYPKDMEPPERDLEYYKSLRFPYAPGIQPRWN